MNDDQMEAYLREMSPAPLPPALLGRLLSRKAEGRAERKNASSARKLLSTHLAAPAPRRELEANIHWLFFAGPPLALAALLFTVALLDGLSTPRNLPPPPRVALQRPPAVHPPPAGPQPSDYRVFLPVAQRSTLLNLSPGIVVEAGPHRPLRLMKAKWLDDTTYVGDDHSTLHRRTARTGFIVVAFNSL